MVSPASPYPREAAPDPVTSRSEAAAAARTFRKTMEQRRNVREFSDDPVPEQIVHDAIAAAATAPSGANLQPWRLVLVGDPEVKRRLRMGAEEEERRFYESRAAEEWLAALAPPRHRLAQAVPRNGALRDRRVRGA